MHKQWAVLAVAGVVVSACSDPITPSGPARLAPVAEVSGDVQSQVVANEYIVALRASQVSAAQLGVQAQSMAAAAGAQITYVYGAALNGFAVKADAAAIAAIRANTSVEYVEPVQVYRTTVTQTGATWGIDRVDQRNLPLSTTYTYPTGGSAVHIYIIDTGIRLTHNDFAGRMGNGFDAVTSGGNANDCNGHGTHVAGTAGGTIYGIMKTATLHPVRVLNCGGSGTNAGVIAGINWVASNAIAPAVSNMSLGGGASTSIDNATNAMVAAGVVSAVAAGNGDIFGNPINACTGSPARAASAITVGATTSSDARASFSNFGTCLDIFAPGVNITSDWNNSNTGTNTISGTSMASPHVAGVAALYRSQNPTHTAAQTAAAIINNATTGIVTNPGTGSPNRLLYMAFLNAPPPTNQPPVANFTFTCVPGPSVEFRCTFNGSTSTDPDGTIALYSWAAPGNPNKTGVQVIYGFPPGTYDVTLTVTDNNGAPNSKTQAVTVGGPPTNQLPTANFTHSCVPGPSVERRCTFDGSTSTDPDGTIVSYAWSAPGNPNKSGVTAIYGFPVGTWAVTLTVTDNNGGQNTKTINIVVQ